MKLIIGVVSDLIHQRWMVWSLAWRDFRHRYVRNLLGIVWAIIDPLVFVGILYLIFKSGIGNKITDDVPFVVYILCGNIAFDLFNNLQILTQVIKDHEFLVKKMNFNTVLLPASRLISILMIHGIILAIAIIIILISGIHPTLYWFQLLYYTLSQSVLLFGTSLLTSSISLFFPDISHIIPILTRVLFFLTPVFWQMDLLSDAVSHWLMFNPMVYIVNGYRDSLLYGKGFWLYPNQTMYFWICNLFLLWLGAYIHRKLRPHFAEVI